MVTAILKHPKPCVVGSSPIHPRQLKFSFIGGVAQLVEQR